MDVYELCTTSLQQRLSAQRQGKTETADATNSTSSASAMDVDGESSPSTNTTRSGVYDLKCIVTHKGRSADSGHYMSYVKLPNPQNGGVEEWFKFDDATVTIVAEEEVLRLCGGGDRDMAYFCIYETR